MRQLALTGYANGQLHVHILHSLKLVVLGTRMRKYFGEQSFEMGAPVQS